MLACSCGGSCAGLQLRRQLCWLAFAAAVAAVLACSCSGIGGGSCAGLQLAAAAAAAAAVLACIKAHHYKTLRPGSLHVRLCGEAAVYTTFPKLCTYGCTLGLTYFREPPCTAVRRSGLRRPAITLRRAEAVHLGRVGSGAADAELGVWMITQEQILTNF